MLLRLLAAAAASFAASRLLGLLDLPEATRRNIPNGLKRRRWNRLKESEGIDAYLGQSSSGGVSE